MDLVSIVAAGSNGSGDFVVGLIVGCCIGVLVGPVFRSWQTYREWADASRQVPLEDQLLERMESEAELEEWSVPTEADDRATVPAWRTRP